MPICGLVSVLPTEAPAISHYGRLLHGRKSSVYRLPGAAAPFSISVLDQECLELVRPVIEVDTGAERVTEQNQREIWQASRQHIQARTAARIQFGGSKAVPGHDAVDREGATEVDRALQLGADSTRDLTHVVAVFGTRIPIRGDAGVDEPTPLPTTSQSDDLNGTKCRNVVVEDDAVNAARNAFEKRHDPDAITLRS
jgi:hypothetical protein